MSEIRIIFDLEGKAAEAFGKGVKTADIITATIEAIGGLPAGMTSGKTSVGLCITTEDGKKVYAETSLKMLQMVTAGLTARYGDETGGTSFMEAAGLDADKIREALADTEKKPN